MRKPLIFTIILLGLFSCEKSIEATDSSLIFTTSIPSQGFIDWNTYSWNSFSGIDPSNSLNIYDNIGKEHNDRLNYLFMKLNENGRFPLDSTTLIDSIYLCYTDILIDAGYTDSISTLESYLTNHLDLLNSSIDYETMMENFSFDSTSNAKKIQIFNDILDTVETLNINQIIDNVKSKELTIINDSILTNDQKNDILSCTSLFRYSIAYWYDVDLNRHPTFDDLDIAGSETDTIFAASDYRNKSYTHVDRIWAESVKGRDAESTNAAIASAILYVADAVTSAGAWVIEKISDGIKAISDWLDDLI